MVAYGHFVIMVQHNNVMQLLLWV